MAANPLLHNEKQNFTPFCILGVSQDKIKGSAKKKLGVQYKCLLPEGGLEA